MRNKSILFLLLTLAAFALFSMAGCNKPRRNISRPAPIHTPETASHDSSKAIVKQHPYGNPYTGVLPWEDDAHFRAIRTEKNLTVRMGAFKTTLPDPLPGEEANVAQAADYLAGQIVQPGKSISLYHVIGPFTKKRGYQEGPAYRGSKVVKTTGGGVCKIASTLYNVAILADLKILERHPHGMPVPYVPPGQDATISGGSKDFRFMNNTGEPVLIWADTQGNTLYIAFYGKTEVPQVTWNHQILKRFPTHTIYRTNKNLRPGEKRTIVPGADGLIVKSWLTIKYPDGSIKQKKRGTDYYKPLPYLIEIR